jgi:hypothetical protein
MGSKTLSDIWWWEQIEFLDGTVKDRKDVTIDKRIENLVVLSTDWVKQDGKSAILRVKVDDSWQ